MADSFFAFFFLIVGDNSSVDPLSHRVHAWMVRIVQGRRCAKDRGVWESSIDGSHHGDERVGSGSND